jgi:transcriptional regulator with XRE-family HTH domain
MIESTESRPPWELFGALLRERRKAAGLTVTAFARIIYYTKGHVSKVERGETIPDLDFVKACAGKLDIPDDLVLRLAEAPVRRTRPFVRLRTLPAAPAGFIGRADELRTIDAVLRRESGICVITGIGGSGKTALAVRAAYAIEGEFTDGCLFLELAPAASAEGYEPAADALDRALRLLGLGDDRIPARLEDRAVRYRERLRGRRVLIVIDNAVSAAQILPLTPAEPGCRMLVASRARLAALDQASHLPLGSLPEDAALELFHAVSGLAGGHVEATEDRKTCDVVARCAGMPMAIRIAAARLQSNEAWTIDDLHDRLSPAASRLDELDDGERSVRAVLTTHLNTLAPAQRRLFGLLGMLPSAEFSVTHVAALSDLTISQADRLLAGLYHLHFVESMVSQRFRIHDLLHELAVGGCETAVSAEDRAAAFGRYLTMMLNTTAYADALLEPYSYRPDLKIDPVAPRAVVFEDGVDALHWLDTEWRTLAALCRRAGESGEFERCWMLAFVLRGYFFRTKRFDPWIATQRWAVEAARAVGDQWALGASLSNLGAALFDLGELDAASECFREAAPVFKALRDGHALTNLLADSGWLSIYRGEYDLAVRDLRKAVSRYEYQGKERNAAISRRGLALALTALGEHVRAIESAEKALEAFEELELNLDAAMAVNCLAWAHYRSGSLTSAKEGYRAARQRAEDCGSLYEAARAELGLGNVAASAGDLEAAARWWTAAELRHPSVNPVMVPEAGERDFRREADARR